MRQPYLNYRDVSPQVRTFYQPCWLSRLHRIGIRVPDPNLQ